MKHALLLAMTLLAAPWMSGDALAQETSDSAASAQRGRIINGTPTDQFPAVGIVGDTVFGGFCSGTLIGDRWVLTAAHCAIGIPANGGVFILNGVQYGTVNITIHPEFVNGFFLPNDVAIFELDRPVPNVQPMEIFRREPQRGTVLTLVGFGGGGNPIIGSDGDFGTKRVGTTTLDFVGSNRIAWFYGSLQESNTAPGDSGGPAMILDTDGVMRIAGTTSGGTRLSAGLGDIAFDARTDAFASFIDSVTGNTPPPAVLDPASDSRFPLLRATVHPLEDIGRGILRR